MAPKLELPPSTPLTGGDYWTWDPDDRAYWRIYHKDWQTPTGLARREYGPHARFDHHRRDANDKPQYDPASRSLTYLGEDIATAGAEAFWDADPPTRIAQICPRHHIAQLRPTEPLRLLDLRGGGADLIGANTQLFMGPSSDDERRITQAWATKIYEDLKPAGVLYPGSHQQGLCIALFDLAQQPALTVVSAKGVPREMAVQAKGMWKRFRVEYSRNSNRTAEKIDSSDCGKCGELTLSFVPKQ